MKESEKAKEDLQKTIQKVLEDDDKQEIIQKVFENFHRSQVKFDEEVEARVKAKMEKQCQGCFYKGMFPYIERQAEVRDNQDFVVFSAIIFSFFFGIVAGCFTILEMAKKGITW